MLSHSPEDLGFKKLPPRTSWKEKFSSEGWWGAYSYSYGFSTPCILLERSLSVCRELMGRDERSKAAMQINHLSVPPVGKKAGDQFRAIQSYGNSFQLDTEQERMVGGHAVFGWKNEKQKCNWSWLQNFGIPRIPDALKTNAFSLPHTLISSLTSFSSFLSSFPLLLICNLPA